MGPNAEDAKILFATCPRAAHTGFGALYPGASAVLAP